MEVNLDVSLEQRISANKASSGPVRTGRGRGAALRREKATPYPKPQRAPYEPGDSESKWKHDLFPAAEGINGGTLGARLLSNSARGGKVDFSGVKGFLSGAQKNGNGRERRGIQMRGAGGERATVRVDNLVEGTTAADVEAIFKQVGAVVSASLEKAPHNTVSVVLKYKDPSHADEAVKRFNDQVADGRTLKVSLVGPASPQGNGIDLLDGKDGLMGRLGISSRGVDLLGDSDSGSKMRSDALLDDPRSQVVVASTFDGNGRANNGRQGGGGGGRRRNRGGNR